VNQFFMSPFLNALFFTYVILTRNNTSNTTPSTKKDYSGFKKHTTITTPTKLQLIQKKLSQDLLPTIYRSCIYWITLNLINFRFVKVHQRQLLLLLPLLQQLLLLPQLRLNLILIY